MISVISAKTNGAMGSTGSKGAARGAAHKRVTEGPLLICLLGSFRVLRALYLTLLARLASHHYSLGSDGACQDYALRLLAYDPCREDAHRLVMRCYVRRGERSQALRQYRLCETVLKAEFDTEPEPATKALFNQLRLDPASV